jgi:hypothetical protein
MPARSDRLPMLRDYAYEVKWDGLRAIVSPTTMGGLKLGGISVGIAVIASGAALAGCGGASSGTRHEPRKATDPGITPKEPTKVAAMSDAEAHRPTVKRLLRKGNALLDQIHALARRADPATNCGRLPKLEQEIWDLDDVVANLEGIGVSAGTDGVRTMRREVDEMTADFQAAKSACGRMGR